MKKIFFILIFFIIIPSFTYSASSSINGFWLSDDTNLLRKHELIIINNNMLQHGKREPENIIISNEDNIFIIHFQNFKINEEMYNKWFYKISILDNDRISIEYPTAGGKRKEKPYHRITEEEAKQYLR